jgi:hypothetical protein
MSNRTNRASSITSSERKWVITDSDGSDRESFARGWVNIMNSLNVFDDMRSSVVYKGVVA